MLLLNTCAAFCWWEGDPRLTAAATLALSDPKNEIFFHQVSYLEITLKFSLGKLPLNEAQSQLIPKAVAAYQLSYVRLSNDDIRGVEAMPFHHRDPFDRLLIAHARRAFSVHACPRVSGLQPLLSNRANLVRLRALLLEAGEM